MINRLRVILPPDSVVIGVVLAFALVEGPFIFLEWKLQQALDIPRPGALVLDFIAFFYGFWRVSSFHPAFQNEYRAWLERSPWTYRSALPAGPINLIWEDALPLGGLGVMAAFAGPVVPYRVMSLFLIGHLLALTSAFFRTRSKGFGYVLAFGIGLGLRFWPDPIMTLVIVSCVYLIGMLGLRFSLQRFPWPFFANQPRTSSQPEGQEDVCGWPFDQLRPPVKPSLGGYTRFDGLMIGVLSGWFLFAFESLFSDPSHQLFLVQKGFTMAIGILATVRMSLYCSGYAPPISLLGRIRTFRWLIPGYDQVFVGPLCTILVGVLAIDRFRPPGLNDLIVLPVALSVATTVALDTGPSLRKWRLTGQHRITATAAKMGDGFVKVG